MTRHLTWFLTSLFAVPALAGPLEPGTETAQPGVVVCLGSPERTLAWLDAAVVRARSLGLLVRVFERLSDQMKTDIGANLLTPGGWTSSGFDPARPLCLAGPVPGTDRVVVFVGVRDGKKALEVIRRIAGKFDKALGTPKSFSREGAKVWTFRSKAGGEALAFAVRDGIGYVGESADDLDLYLRRPRSEPAANLSFPDGDISIVLRVAVRALGQALNEEEISRIAETMTPEVTGEFVLRGREANLAVRGPSVGLLALVGSVLEKTSPNAGRAALERLPGDASGFVQVRLPLATILQAIGTLRGQGATHLGLPPGWDDLVQGLSGDALVVAQDGLAGLTLMAGVSNETAVRRAILAIAESLHGSGLSASIEDMGASRGSGWVLRFGTEDSPIRLPVFVVLRDQVLAASLSRPRLEALFSQVPVKRYLDSLDHRVVLDGLRSGAVLVAHGYESDSLGNLLPYAAIVREALQGEASVWMDLVDAAFLSMDLTYDSGLTATISSSQWSLRMVTRYLGVDPGSADPNERLFAQAVRARMEGRLAAARETLFTLAQSGRNGLHGSKARRCLQQPEPLSDFLVGAVIAGVLFTWQARTALTDGVEDFEEAAPEMSPCEQYLLRACRGPDPDVPACRKARAFFEREGGPTAQDQERCRDLLETDEVRDGTFP